jgi:hypothetical protein
MNRKPSGGPSARPLAERHSDQTRNRPPTRRGEGRQAPVAVASVMAHSRAAWLAGHRVLQVFTFGHDDDA